MSYALIDNATLTAVQRLLGTVASRSRDSVDGDIAALENVVTAILFYDELICLDNYKEEFRTTRRDAFPFIRFYGLDNVNLRELDNSARAESLSFRPEIRGGEFVDADYRAFLEQLRMHIVCTWDISSSVYYLTMKMLGMPETPEFEKYGKLSAAIFGELVDAKETNGPADLRDNFVLVDSRGTPIGNDYRVPNAKWGDGITGGLTPALRVFLAALNWTAYKSIYYTLAARALHADSLLYPTRQAFQLRWMQKTGMYSSDFASGLLRQISEHSRDDVKCIVEASRSYIVNIPIPFFTAWITSKVGDVSEVIEYAQELRGDKRIQAVREQMGELRYLLDSGEGPAATTGLNKIVKKLADASLQMRREFSVVSRQTVSPKNLIKGYNTLASAAQLPRIPEIDIPIPIPDGLRRPSTGFATLYRDIVRDLSDIARLETIRDVLGRRVQVNKDARVYNPKTEAPEFRNRSSEWKSPM